MAFDFIAWHGRDLNNHNFETQKAAALGYRTLSLSVYGQPNAPVFAAVMVRRPVVHAEQQFQMLTKTQLSEKIDELWEKGLGAYLITAVGTVQNPFFTASFRPMATQPIVRFGILGTGDQMLQLHYGFWHDGYIPVSLDAYGTPDDTQLVAIWHKNPARITWNIEGASRLRNVSDQQAFFNAVTAQGGRPTVTALAPGNRYIALFVDNQVGSWVTRGELTGDAYQNEFNKQVAAGRCPVWVAGEGVGADTRYVAIFADREQPVDRQFTATTTLKDAPTVQGIDDAMMKFMQDHAMRGCALAITKGTRLVYARGYTLAEPGYPVLKDVTLFRQASVSKFFAAAAIYRLIQQNAKAPDGSPFTLDTTLQTVLNLTVPPKSTNKMDDRFKNITIRHLMESISSIDQGWLWWHQEAAAAFGSPLPGKPQQLASFIAAQKLGTKNPGDKTNVVYGNVDYFLLSQVVARMAGTDTFEQGLAKLVLGPLQIKRVRGSVSLQQQQAADEARYHLVDVDPAPKTDKPNEFNDYPPSLWVVSSSVSDDHPLVPQQYGGDNYEVFDGCGGLSAAVTDIARLVAALSLRDPKAVLSDTTLKNWFGNAVSATQTNTNADPTVPVHGFHGFDGGWLFDNTQDAFKSGNFTAGKGGWLPSHSTAFSFVSGGYGYVIACNSVGQSDVKTDWLRNLDGLGEWWQVDPGSVMGVAETHDWGTTDLFPGYGMPSFTALPFTGLVGTIDVSKLAKNAAKLHGVNSLEQQSMLSSLKQKNRSLSR